MPDAPYRKLLFLTPTLNGADGISTLCRQALRACKPWADRQGVEVSAWSLMEGPDALRPDCERRIHYRFAGTGKLRYAGWGCRRALSPATDTLVVAMHVAMAPIALPMVFRGAHLTVVLLGVEVWRPLKPLQAASLHRAENIVSISRYTADEFKRHNPAFRTRQIDVCHLAAPPMPPPANTTDGRRPFALIVARMSSEERYKGHDLLLELWPRLLAEVPHARLCVAGDGDDRARLQQRAKSLGLEGHVEFLGRVSDEQLSQLYQDCAYFVMPSPREGFGLVFVEAMRAGKACVGSVGAAAEIIEHGRTGLIVNPANRDEVLSALLTMFRDPAARRRMGQAGADRFSQYFTEQHFHRRFSGLLGLARAA